MKTMTLIMGCLLLILFSCEYHQDNGITSIDDVIASDYLLTDDLDEYISPYQIVRFTGKPGITTIEIGGTDLSKYQPCFVLYVATGTTPETDLSGKTTGNLNDHCQSSSPFPSMTERYSTSA